MARKRPVGRPSNPRALRRTGVPVHLLLPPEAKRALAAYAQAQGISMAQVVVRALRAIGAIP